MVRESDGRERLLLDPNASDSPSGTGSVTEYSPSPDGTLVAVNVDHGGNEITQVTILDVATGAPRPDAVDAIWGEIPVNWLPDSRGFTYTQMAPAGETAAADPMTNMRVRLHRLGSSVQADPVLLRSGMDHLPLAPDEIPTVDAGADSPFAVALAGGARPESRICVIGKARALSPDAPWHCVADYADDVESAELHGSTLYLLSKRGAPNGRILALDLRHATRGLRDARVLVPESHDAVLTGTAAAHDALYIRRMRVGVDSLLRLPYAGRAAPIAMPFAGAAYQMSTRPTEDGLVYTLQGWTRPRAAFAYAPSTGVTTDLALGANSPADYGSIVAEETDAVSRDGTRVPLTVIARRDAPRDGSNLAILEGYGSYGISEQPYFDPLVLEWVKAGHVYAVAHVRGGGERGNAWWLGGKPPRKANGVADFVACAERLAALGWTSAPADC